MLNREVIFNQVIAEFELWTFSTGAQHLSHLSIPSYSGVVQLSRDFVLNFTVCKWIYLEYIRLSLLPYIPCKFQIRSQVCLLGHFSSTRRKRLRMSLQPDTLLLPQKISVCLQHSFIIHIRNSAPLFLVPYRT